MFLRGAGERVGRSLRLGGLAFDLVCPAATGRLARVDGRFLAIQRNPFGGLVPAVRLALTVGPGAGPGLSLVLLAIDAFQAASLVELGVHPRLVHAVGLELGPGVSLVCGLFSLGLEASRLRRLRGLGLLVLTLLGEVPAAEQAAGGGLGRWPAKRVYREQVNRCALRVGWTALSGGLATDRRDLCAWAINVRVGTRTSRPAEQEVAAWRTR
jgi:hypothetical protein